MAVVYLGLGSNLGCPPKNLSAALRSLISQEIISSPVRFSSAYQSEALVPAGAPSAWNKDFLNIVIEAETSLEPRALLAKVKEVEKHLGRRSAERWAPRLIDIDILHFEGASFKDIDFEIPHPEIENRDFVLRPLGELFKDCPVVETPPSPAARKTPISILPTQVVGVLNVTPDSFSDGGCFVDPEAAAEHLQRLVEEGASIIDIGAESTRPGASRLSSNEEWARIEPVLKRVQPGLRREHPFVRLSIDTRYAETAERAVEFGVDIVNDVSGLQDDQMIPLLAASDLDYVLMHSLSVPADPSKTMSESEDVIEALKLWKSRKLECLSQISADRVIFDPGVGFGKTPTQNLEILRRVSELFSSEHELYVGHSRKSFMRLLSIEKAADRDLETHIFSSKLTRDFVAYLRVHDVKGTVRALKAAWL